MISIHTPTKGATQKSQRGLPEKKISIHTPTKGATRSNDSSFLYLGISIHTPTKGATVMMELLYKAGGHFNPHSHEGSDDIRFVSVKFGNIFQSTLPRRERRKMHGLPMRRKQFQSTLPRRERLAHMQSGSPYHYFNPHSHEGSDACQRHLDDIEKSFQSTLPRRERLMHFKTSFSFDDFNPHSHEGSDDYSLFFHSDKVHFNPHSHEGSDM